jgi:hypothetical protein
VPPQVRPAGRADFAGPALNLPMGFQWSTESVGFRVGPRSSYDPDGRKAGYDRIHRGNWNQLLVFSGEPPYGRFSDAARTLAIHKDPTGGKLICRAQLNLRALLS